MTVVIRRDGKRVKDKIETRQLQLQHCAILQTGKDAGPNSDEAFVDGRCRQLLFEKDLAISTVQNIQQSSGAPFESAEWVRLVEIIRPSPNQ